ncbi:hypothetical protein JQC67_18030 [Aurantibacter crassamenti]|uniref:hypothetical protein n=1 Tax=Aurantibacter crassamenti TaxID=1837375 RepID=UPI00193A1C19|nr:hypothetical protein [Aurantibacter crassamenti]MBM1108056.1 hypothetical protein [Aurantibacter crassamenti]
MRKSRLILLIALFAMPAIFGQIKIGDNPQAISPTSVLELESNDRVLVITRITTAQMDAIVPNQGAMIYNTDTQCIHYYDGTQWVNLCDSAGFEVADNSIKSNHIDDFSIQGNDIQDGAIGLGKLQNGSVTVDKLSQNAVGPYAINRDSLPLSYFDNDLNLLTIDPDAANDITNPTGNGAFYDNQPVLDLIDANTTFINGHITADQDINPNNEIQTITFDNGTNILTLEHPSGNTTANLSSLAGGAGNTTDELITAAILNASNELVITEGGLNTTIDLSSLAGGGGQNLTNVLTQGNDAGTNKIIGLGAPTNPNDAATKAYVDANVGGNQNLAQVLTQGTDGGAALIKNILDPVDPQDAATRAYVLAAVASGGAITDGSILIGGAGDVAQQLAVSGDATLANDGALTIEDDAVELNMLAHPDPAATIPPANGDIMVWDNDNLEWKIDTQAGEHSGTANAIFFADKDPANLGKPTTTDDNSYANDDGGFYWDPEGRKVGTTGYGALYVGLDGNPQSDEVKVHIAESKPGFAYALELQNRNNGTGTTTGILFSTEGSTTYGKGGLVYERTGGFARGDFHFLQNSTTSTVSTDLNDKAFTIKNNGDIVLYGGIDIDGIGTGGTNQVLTSDGAGGILWGAGGSGTDNQQLTLETGNLLTLEDGGTAINLTPFLDDQTAADVSVAATATNYTAATADVEAHLVGINTALASGGHNGTAAGSIFFAAATTPFAPTENNAQLFWDNTDNKLYVGPQFIDADNNVKLNIGGTARTQGIKNSQGSAALPSYRFTDDVNSGMFLPVEDELGFSTVGTEAIRIDPDQQVGVSIQNPTSTLHVNGTFATAIRNPPGDTSLTDDDYTLILNSGAGPTDIALPDPATSKGRIYIIKNPSASPANFSGFDYVPSTSTVSTNVIPASAVLQIQSDGADWQQIN